MAELKKKVAFARGDGIGPEIMDATLRILEAAGAELDLHEVEIGEQVYLRGVQTGIEEKTWETLLGCEAFLKAPITTPQGGGFKSLNVTIRGAFGLYANVRPCISYAPFVDTLHPTMNVVVIRENEEDLYAGIEYRPTDKTRHALKVITEEGCDRIIRYAFNYAVAHGRKKVTCFTKDNILKLSDGLFHERFEEIAKEYPQVENEHWIIDIGAAKVSDRPDLFDVVVMPNLYGDIVSDITAQIAGSVGLAGSANIGSEHSMFEAIHGSAPRRAGQNLANPSGLLLGSVMMLDHLGLSDAAAAVQNGWLRTIEEGIHTYDIYKEGVSKQKVGTKEFADAIIGNLGKKPETLSPAQKQQPVPSNNAVTSSKATQKSSVGVDVFVEWKESLETLVSLAKEASDAFTLTLITSRGTRAWPTEIEAPHLSDNLRLRFRGKNNQATQSDILNLLNRLDAKNLDITETHTLYSFDGKEGFSLSEY